MSSGFSEPAFINDRLSLPTIPRLTLITLSSSVVTFFIGSIAGGKKTAYQFLAENAHRMPRTHQGWYFYHKTKNYRVMFGGIKAGFSYARRTMLWTALYTGMEASLDGSRDTVDAGNSVVAAILTASLFSWRNGFSRQLTKRTVRMSGLVGLGLGILQDGLIYAKGGRIWYLERLQSKRNRPAQ